MNVKRLLVLLIAGTVAACGVAPTPQPTPIQSSTPTATLRPSSPTTAVPSATASPVPSGSPATLAVSTFKFPDSLDVADCWQQGIEFRQRGGKVGCRLRRPNVVNDVVNDPVCAGQRIERAARRQEGLEIQG